MLKLWSSLDNLEDKANEISCIITTLANPNKKELCLVMMYKFIVYIIVHMLIKLSFHRIMGQIQQNWNTACLSFLI